MQSVDSPPTLGAMAESNLLPLKPKPQASVRLDHRAKTDLERLATGLGKSQSNAAAVAIRHALSTLLRDQPFYVTLPDPALRPGGPPRKSPAAAMPAGRPR
jgi:hypothetical protein